MIIPILSHRVITDVPSSIDAVTSVIMHRLYIDYTIIHGNAIQYNISTRNDFGYFHIFIHTCKHDICLKPKRAKHI